jgi:ankyrin repeat protein
MELLIDSGADMEKERFGAKPLHVAASAGKKDAVEFLISRGADVDSQGEYGLAALHIAVRAYSIDVARLLICRGANVNVTDRDGRTPLDYAESEEIRELLLKHSAIPGKPGEPAAPFDEQTGE